MKTSARACVVAAALLGLAALVHADEHERGGRHWEGQGGGWRAQPQQGWQREGGGPPPGRGWRRGEPPPGVMPPAYAPPQRFERQGPPVYVTPVPSPQYAPPPQYLPPPTPRWNHARGFRPGDALPPEYRQRQFIVRDWRSHRLYAPPPGYVWVQPEPGSYLLIGSNGIIANLLVGQ